MSNGFDLTIENLKTELHNIRLKISELRKAGLDAKIAELKAMSLPYKIQLAEATKSYKDIEKINIMLEDVKKEIGSMENADKTGINSDNLNQIIILIGKINKSISSIKLDEARHYYFGAVELYKSLKAGEKKEVFAKLNEVWGKLAKK